MAVEGRRGCGFRKVGGMYLMGGKPSAGCGRLPLPLVICPTCGGGIKQTRGWTWIDPATLFSNTDDECRANFDDASLPCLTCPVSKANIERMGEKAGLLWIGASFYKTTEHFMHEARTMGVCRRISTVPRGFKLGEHWVLLAHPQGATQKGKRVPGIFSVFKPEAIEKIVTETESKDEAAMAKLRERGITPVAVPDDDPDHRGTVYDKEGET